MARRRRLPPFTLGFGLEKVGLLTLRHPLAMGAVLAVLAAIAAYGLLNLRFDQNMRDVFHGETETYRVFAATTADIADPENEMLALVEGPALGEPATFQRLQDFHFELQLMPGVGSVFSPFSLRLPPEADGEIPALIDDPSTGLTPELLASIRAHPLLGEKLLSADGTAMLFVVTPELRRARLDDHRAIREGIHAAASLTLAEADVTVEVTGFSAVRVAVVDLLLRDQLILNGMGLVIGLVMSLILFRSPAAALMTALPGAAAGLIMLGLVGAAGFRISVLTNVIPILVMIIGYADAMHLNYAWRRHRDSGASPSEAERLALLEVAPACQLTALTTAIAFLSLTFSDVRLISEFGWVGAASVLGGASIVLVAHAFIATLIGRRWRADRSLTHSLFGRLAGPSAAVGAFSARHAWPVSLGALVLVVLFGAAYLSLAPEHSVREHLPLDNPVNSALGTIDGKLAGAFPVTLFVPLAGQEPTSPEAIAKIGAVQDAVATVPGVLAPLSLASVARWVGGRTSDEVSARVRDVLAEMGPDIGERFWGRAGAVITVNIHEATTAATEALTLAIERAARAVAPDAIVTGATVVTAREATRTIAQLNWNLATDVVAALILIVIAFRMPALGWLALIPNLLPLLATGALLFLQGQGLQFTTVVALTVAYGIAIDDTVHYLNALLRGERGEPDPRKRIVATARRIGPVIIGTTVVIIAGLSTTMTSSLPAALLFGQLVMITLAVGVLCDLVILPALIAGPGRRWLGGQGSTAATPADAAAPEAVASPSLPRSSPLV